MAVQITGQAFYWVLDWYRIQQLIIGCSTWTKT